MATAAARFGETQVEGSLRGWFRAFLGNTSPRLIVPALSAVIGARLAVGSWSRGDLIVAAAFVAAQPFTEWLIHVFVLHFKPRTVGRRRVDLYIARKHRAHHRDPWDIGLVFVPTPTLISLFAGIAVIYTLAFRDAHLGLTAAMTSLTLLLVYEWTHFLIHSPYAPKSRLYRYVWRAHRLHHFKNEHYWFGITSHVADHVLRTFPERTGVETSPTARTLGVAA